MAIEEPAESRTRSGVKYVSGPTAAPSNGSGKKTIIIVLGGVMALVVLYVGIAIFTVNRHGNELKTIFENISTTIPE